MPRVVCGDCHRKFSESRYFTHHLNAKKNGACKYASFHKKRQATGPGGLSIPIRKDTFKKKAIIEGQIALDTLMEDYTVFDFNDSSSDSGEEVPGSSSGGNVDNDSFYGMEKNGVDKEDQNASNNQTVGLQQFYEYVARAALDHVDLTPEMKAAVELMHMMNTKGGSLEL
jgi:hypothetical protein